VKFFPKLLDDAIGAVPVDDRQVAAVLNSYTKQKEVIVKLIASHDKMAELYEYITVPYRLNPAQITELSPLIREVPGAFFLNKVLQESYDAGNNNFFIDTADSMTHYLGERLRGTLADPIKITVRGNGGNYFGHESTCVSVAILGSAGNNLGHFSKHFSAFVQGNSGDNLGFSSKYLDARILGNNGGFLGWISEYLHATIDGDNGDDLGWGSKYLRAIVRGNCGNRSGWKSHYLHASVYGNNGDELGSGSFDITATILGNTGKIFSEISDLSQNAHITLYGMADVGTSNRACGVTVYVHNSETYKNLQATGADVRMIK
jgi:formylmethanofuran dehydrogenase subunit C